MFIKSLVEKSYALLKALAPLKVDTTKPVLEGNPAEPMKAPVKDRQEPTKSRKFRATKPCNRLAIRVYHWMVDELDKFDHVKPEWCSSHCGNIAERVVTKSKDPSCMSGCCLMCNRERSCKLPEYCKVALAIRVSMGKERGRRKNLIELKTADIEPYTEIKEEENNGNKD